MTKYSEFLAYCAFLVFYLLLFVFVLERFGIKLVFKVMNLFKKKNPYQ